MTSILKRISGWLGGSKSDAGPSTLRQGRESKHSTILDGSDSAVRGQLVQVLLRDLVRKSGMPPGFVQCQIQVINSRSRGNGIFVRLVVKDWDERLMKYAFAFQRTLLTNIVQFEPKAAGWLQGLAWQLEVAETCPFKDLPGPEFWQTPGTGTIDPFDIIALPANANNRVARVGQKAVPSPDLMVLGSLAAAPPASAPTQLPSLAKAPDAVPDDTAQDLERLFAIRDNELAQMAANNMLPPGYDTTEASPLVKN